MKRPVCLLLVLLLLLPVAVGAAAETETYIVPNPENIHHAQGTDGPLLALTPLGQVTTGNLTGDAYMVSYVGPEDSVWARCWRDGPGSMLSSSFEQLQQTDGVTTQWKAVKVNGTEAALYTYPNGGRVLFAWALPQSAPVLIVESGCGLRLAAPLASAATPEPTPEPTQRPRTISGTGMDGVDLDWKNSDLAKGSSGKGSTGIGGVDLDWKNSGLAKGSSGKGSTGIGGVDLDWKNSGLADQTIDISDVIPDALTGVEASGGRCSVCLGTGECRACDGTGREEVFWLAGWGTVKSTDPDSIRYRDCKMCGGTGKCPYCQ